MIPQSTKYQIDQYAENHIPPGGFVLAVLENNLMEAFSRADDNNTFYMRDIAAYIYNNIPLSCWGSPEIVKNWLETPQRNKVSDNS